MNVLDLFSGIGGFSLGLERAGFTTVAFCEIDPYCRAVLRKHWPDVPVHDDIRTLRGDRFGPIDLVCGGFPCQPFSTAGQQVGKADDRWLWPEMYRVLDEIRPTWIIGENVAGLINMGLDDVLYDLENLNYAVRSFIIPACAIGAPHRRDRLWFIGYADRGSKPTCTINDEARWLQTLITNPEWWEQPLGGDISGAGRLRQSIPWDSSGKPKDYAEFLRMDDGFPHRMDRLRALGNAVVPQVVEMIGRAIMEVHQEPSGGMRY